LISSRAIFLKQYYLFTIDFPFTIHSATSASVGSGQSAATAAARYARALERVSQSEVTLASSTQTSAVDAIVRANPRFGIAECTRVLNRNGHWYVGQFENLPRRSILF
jgi:hypothetical protein